ncbi:LPS assembly lipoprotein LptE [Qipengyuania sediminis]|uniref:LPS assembly lipoprotein LptE n=1 Tax=Qipengyuania sediminis TaxID=1532023 RepID=UPI001059BD21|nr:LPS assembly lipoprotein LptE [Qipengyuania sediminis]
MKAALALLAPLALTACGLSPMYAGGGSGAVAAGLAEVAIPAIEGRSGWLVRNALTERFRAAGASAPRYRLDVRLDERLEGLGVLSDDTTARERLTLRARYQLVDTADGSIVLDATDGTDAGIDVVSSEYAVIAAERSAEERLAKDLADRITARVALALRRLR